MKYKAFISYSRDDARVARRLHRALEHYRVPGGIEGGDARRKLGRFFRDDDEFPASEHLGAAINGAIDDSEGLIVVASPSAARSKWVNKEVIRFKRRHEAMVLVLIARGRPGGDDPAVECFPPALRYAVDADGNVTDEPADEPLAANLSADGFSRAFIRLVAGLLRVPFDTLWRRERRRRIRRRIAFGTGIGVVLSIATVVLAMVVTENDISALRDRSVLAGAEQWRFFGEGEDFDPAYRAALAAIALDRPSPEGPWDLNSYSDSTARALALSGRALPSRRIFGEYPDTSGRGNYRDDIPDADPARRVAINTGVAARDVCFSGDSRRLGLAVSDGRVLVYDVASGVAIYSDTFEEVGPSSRIALDETGGTALVGGRERLLLIDVDSAAVRACSTPGLGPFHEIAKPGTGWLFVAASGGETIVGEFDPVAFGISRSVRIPEFTPYNSSTLSDGGVIFLGYDEWNGITPVLADFTAGPPIKFDGLGSGAGQVKIIAVDETGDLVALGGNGSDGGQRAGAQVVSLRSGSEHLRLIGHTGEIYAADFMTGGDVIATGGSDLSVRLWDPRDGVEILRLAGHLGDIYDISFSPDGEMLATSSSDGMVLLWDTSTLEGPDRGAIWRDALEGPRGEWRRPSAIVTPQERRATAAFRGRPWDVLEWRDPTSPIGIVQSVRALFVRRFGWGLFDYERPQPRPSG